jgi:hypothetical protein
MANTLTEAMATAESTAASMFKSGKERTEAMLGLQKELLDMCDQASRDWLARIKAEAELWSELAAKLTAARSVPEAVESYQQCISQRMKMVTQDAQRLSDDYGSFMQKFTRSLNNGWFVGRT